MTSYQGNNAPQEQWQFSQELQVTGSVGDFNYVAGAYYFEEDADEFNHQFLTLVTPVAGLVYFGFPPAFVSAIQALNPGLDLIGVNAFPPAHFGGTAESTALFGQLSWRPAAMDDKLELTGGLRFTSDEKTLFLDNDGDGRADVRGQDTFTNFSWLVSANYEFADDIMGYGRISTGYKSGGFNPRTSVLNGFDPEEVIAYEAGVKADWLDGRLRTNLALYWTDYTDMQINQFASGSGGATSIILNAGAATIKGVEFEATAVPVDGLTLNASVGYTDPQYDEFLFRDPLTNVVSDVADVARFPNVNEWNWTAGAQYAFPSLGFGEPLAQINYSYRSEIYFHPLDRVNIFNSEVAAPGQGNLSARLILSEIPLGSSSRMEVSVWGDNLADNDELNYGIDFGGLGFGGASFAQPRSYGIDVKVTY